MAEEIRLVGNVGEAAAYGQDYFEDYEYDDGEDWDQEAADAFLDAFEFLGERFPGNPAEDYYQGMNFTTVWERKSDQKKFGFTYWESIAKYGEKYIEPQEYDPENDENIFVFKEVVPFVVQGYHVAD